MKFQIGPVRGETVSESTEGLGHGARIDDRGDREVEALRQIGAAGVAIEQAHHSFDQNQIRMLRSLMQARAAIILTRHPEIELIDRLSRGTFQDHRVEIVGSALEDRYLVPLAAMIAG